MVPSSIKVKGIRPLDLGKPKNILVEIQGFVDRATKKRYVIQ